MPSSAKIHPDTKICRSGGLPQSALGEDDLVILNARAEKYHGLKGPSVRIWNMIKTPTTMGEICAALGDEFEVDAETCANDVEAFIAQLLEEKLVTLEG